MDPADLFYKSLNSNNDASARHQLPFLQSIDPVTQRTAQPTVTCVYRTHIGGVWRSVTVLWSKNLMNYSVSVSVDGVENDAVYSFKIDLKPWHFWAKKGYKAFEVGGSKIEAHWDLKWAKFSTSPEPTSDYYIALVSEHEVVLLLGDYKKKAYKRTKARPALIEPALFYKKENVFAKKSFSTRARFDQSKGEHEIAVESSTAGPREPEMWISVDGIVLIRVTNLQWKFRGNQTVLVDKQPVEVYWDVFPWLHCTSGSNHGLFIFKSGGPEPESDDDSSRCDGSECSGDYYSVQSSAKGSELCLFLYAWKVD